MKTYEFADGTSIIYVSRADWGGGEINHLMPPAPPGRTYYRGYSFSIPHTNVYRLVGHHTVVDLQDYDRDKLVYDDIDDVKRHMRILQTIRYEPDKPYSTSNLGPEVPYSFVIIRTSDPNVAWVCEGRGFGQSGAHTAGRDEFGNYYNRYAYGVAVEGNTNNYPLTPGMKSGVRWIGSQLSAPVTFKMLGHQETGASTSCPGINYLNSIHNELQPPYLVVGKEEDDMAQSWFIRIKPTAQTPNGRVAGYLCTAGRPVEAINGAPSQNFFEGVVSHVLEDSATIITVKPNGDYPTYGMGGVSGIEVIYPVVEAVVDVPTAEEIAEEVVKRLPDAPSVQEIANAVVAAMPGYPTPPSASEIATAVNDETAERMSN